VAIKVKIPRRKSPSGPSRRPAREGLIQTVVAAGIVLCLGILGVFTFYYVKYERIIDERMNGPIFGNSARIYARPQTLRVGQTISLDEIAAELRRAGYADQSQGTLPLGTYRRTGNAIEIRPGPESYHDQDMATVYVFGDKVARIVTAADSGGGEISGYELEPQLITALSGDERRAKRQIVHFADIPKVLVDATLAIEDRRFFEHGGVNVFRMVEAAWSDLRTGGRTQGGSTITMQTARLFHLGGLTAEKKVMRKFREMLIAEELEQRLSKRQIFELYANQVDLGQRGSFAIIGFAEGARAYFNKDLQSLTLPEAALLAGIIQGPSRLSPYRHPERALERRNLVLDSMVETGAISRAEAGQAKALPLKLAPPNVEASDAPYFIDLVKDQVTQEYSEHELNENAYRIYTTIDPNLQRAAAEAVEEGMKLVDAQILKMRSRRRPMPTGTAGPAESKTPAGAMPQVALVALDPHTGEVLTLVGGRDYGLSQLNHAVAKRPTGSIFKPFVYAAAMATGIDAAPEAATTPVSLVDDSPATFAYDNRVYEPRNYKDEYHGEVPLRYALAMSLNNATVKVAEQVGYEKVAQLARAAGIASVRPTPAMALGSYDATPLEMAAAYTVFADGGTRISPLLVRSIRNAQGDVLQDAHPASRPVLDPRVAYVMTSMMEGVVNYGTGFEVRRRGFTAPAAGKTGTSHDAWFAGYTSNLLCVVWVGYDDYSDLRLSGSQSAAPIWGEFMKRAVKLPEYRDVHEFPQPAGVVDVRIDKETNRLATAACPETVTVAFISGTEPKETCEQQPGDHRNLFQRLLGIGGAPAALPPPNAAANSAPPAEDKGNKGLFGKIVGIFKGGEKDQAKPPQR
jgi:penicillin-binding protein 1B